MSHEPQELSPDECADLLATENIGRIAFFTAAGPHIYPVNYVTDGKSVIFRTSPYTTLGTHGWGRDVAFEVDHVDLENQRSWSVMAIGPAEQLIDTDAMSRTRKRGLEPMGAGTRTLFVRITPRKLTGRRLGPNWLRPVSLPPT